MNNPAILLKGELDILRLEFNKNFAGLVGEFNKLGQIHNNLAKVVDVLVQRIIRLEQAGDPALPENPDTPLPLPDQPEPAPAMKIIT